MVLNAYETISAETLDQITAITKAATSGITSATGFYGVDLSGVVSLVPAVTPFYDRVTRVSAPMGATAATWRASLNANASQPNPFVGRDAGGGNVIVSEHDMLAKFQPVRVTGNVTQDAIDLGRGYDDAKARATAATLIQWRIAENKGLIGGNAVALPTTGTTVVTAATTGGTMGNSTVVYIKCAARSASNYYWGGSSLCGTAGTVTTGTTTTTNRAIATVPAVRGAVAYDWYYSTNGSTYYYATTTSVNTVSIPTVISANQALPSSLVLPGLWSTAPTAVPTVDTSYSVDQYNGLITTLDADYSAGGTLVTYGSGDLVSGASIISLDGATLTGASQGITELDQLNAAIFATAQCSPTCYLVSPQQANDMASKILGTNQATTFLARSDDRTGLIGGASIGRYINRSTGDTITVQTDPWMPPGTIVALTETVPYPTSGFSSTYEARTLREVSETAYGTSTSPSAAGYGPRFTWDCSSMESFVNRAPVAAGMLTCVAAG